MYELSCLREVNVMAMSKEELEYKKEREKNEKDLEQLLLARIAEADRGELVSLDKVSEEMKERYGL